ncbi:MAG: hypothetical protein MJ252_16205 [archaeon]|nr:hypothetical protein [archaeon]
MSCNQYWKLSHCPAWSFGKILKGNKTLLDSYGTPGPSTYKPMHTLTHRSIPGFKMCGNGRTNYTKKDNQDNPGVGNYQIPNKFGNEGPKYTMKGPTGSPNNLQNYTSPGPGAYFPKLKATGPAYSLGGRTEKPLENAKNPGVGNYDIRNDKSLEAPCCKFGSEPKGSLSNMANPSNFKKWNEDPSPACYSPNYKNVKPSTIGYSFGCDSRMPDDKARAPGPGNYNFNPKFGKEGTSPTMGANPNYRPLNSRVDEVTPGPGAYNSTMYHKPNAPGFKMGSSGRDVPNMKTNKNNPGPGSYSGDTNLNKLLDSGPKWGMGDGNSTRNGNGLQNAFASCSPGPCYNVAENMGKGPKFSLGSKNYPSTKWKDSLPGPGDYGQGNPATKNNGPKWGLGTCPKGDNRNGKFKNDYPGPGQYNTCRDFNAPCTKFDHSDRMGDLNKGKGKGGKGGEKQSEVSPFSYRIPCSIVCVNPYTRESGKFDPKFRYV